MPYAPIPSIEPVAAGTSRPFWSVMIPTYNRSKYLERTLRSVLDQAPGEDEMQIEVVDNASEGHETEALVREVSGGRVSFFRQGTNIGLVGNWNTCVQRSKGHWVHILHDDDKVLPGFYAAYRQFIEAHTSVGMVFSRSVVIDEDDEWKFLTAGPTSLQRAGVWNDGLLRLLTENPSAYLRCPSIVVARRAYEKAGGFEARSFYTHDLQMWLRVASLFPVGYLHQPLAMYREHQQGITYSLIREHDAVGDMARTLRMGIAMLPPSSRPEARRSADTIIAHLAEMYRGYVREHGDYQTELTYSRHLYRHAPSVRTLLLTLRSWSRFAAHRLKGAPAR